MINGVKRILSPLFILTYILRAELLSYAYLPNFTQTPLFNLLCQFVRVAMADQLSSDE